MNTRLETFVPCHSFIASLMTLYPKPSQTFVRCCFSSSMSWTWWVSHCFNACIHACDSRVHIHAIKSG